MFAIGETLILPGIVILCLVPVAIWMLVRSCQGRRTPALVICAVLSLVVGLWGTADGVISCLRGESRASSELFFAFAVFLFQLVAGLMSLIKMRQPGKPKRVENANQHDTP